MNLTKEKIAEFVGGDMQIQCRICGYLYRGPIKSATIENNMLLVKFAWLAKREGYPSLPIKWKKEENFASLGFVRNLKFYDISEIGNGRICLYNPTRDGLLTLFPANDNLDPAKVKGLKRSIERVPA